MIEQANLSGLTKTNLLADWMTLGFYYGQKQSQLEPYDSSDELDAIYDFMM